MSVCVCASCLVGGFVWRERERLMSLASAVSSSGFCPLTFPFSAFPLPQAELKNFHFQTKFLWPFVSIVSSNPPPPSEIRELVIHVVTNIVRARAHNIRSGWKSVLAVFSVSATDEDPTLVSLAFDTLHTLVQQDQYFPMLSPFFVDAVHCLLSFASNAKDAVAIAAVDHVSELGAHLARGRVPVDDEAPVLPRALWKGQRGSTPVVGEDGEEFTYDIQFWYNLSGPENEDVLAAEQEALKVQLGLCVRMFVSLCLRAYVCVSSRMRAVVRNTCLCEPLAVPAAGGLGCTGRLRHKARAAGDAVWQHRLCRR